MATNQLSNERKLCELIKEINLIILTEETNNTNHYNKCVNLMNEAKHLLDLLQKELDCLKDKEIIMDKQTIKRLDILNSLISKELKIDDLIKFYEDFKNELNLLPKQITIHDDINKEII
uniref:Uncharacterized protein n=1 Tax=viral metagenome TaxID=1070528 RepID=A0A6C0LS38_9ZZZZ